MDGVGNRHEGKGKSYMNGRLMLREIKGEEKYGRGDRDAMKRSEFREGKMEREIEMMC